MTIKFTKTVEITGETMYRIYADDNLLRSFFQRKEDTTNAVKDEATGAYRNIIKAAKENYPITETIDEQVIDIATKP